MMKYATSLEVYEDDVDRNYALVVELLIALKETLCTDGLPHAKDLQAILFGIKIHLHLGKSTGKSKLTWNLHMYM